MKINKLDFSELTHFLNISFHFCWSSGVHRQARTSKEID